MLHRIWGLTTDKAALAAHLAIDKGLNAQQVALVVLLVVGTYMDKGLNQRLQPPIFSSEILSKI